MTGTDARVRPDRWSRYCSPDCLARETHRQGKQQQKVECQMMAWTERPTHGLPTDLEEEQLQPRYVNILYPDSSSLLLHDSRYYVWCIADESRSHADSSKLDSTVLAAIDDLPQTSYADISIDSLQCSSSSFRSLRSLPTTLCNKSCISSRCTPILLKFIPHSPLRRTKISAQAPEQSAADMHTLTTSWLNYVHGEREDAGMKRYGPSIPAVSVQFRACSREGITGRAFQLYYGFSVSVWRPLWIWGIALSTEAWQSRTTSCQGICEPVLLRKSCFCLCCTDLIIIFKFRWAYYIE